MIKCNYRDVYLIRLANFWISEQGKERTMIETNLAQAVDATNDSGPAYDTNIKYLLADKQILSRILKYTMEEFEDMEIGILQAVSVMTLK